MEKRPNMPLMTPEQSELLCIKTALDAAEMGHWTWSQKGAMQWDTRMCHLFEATPSEAPYSVEDFLLKIEESAHKSVIDAFDAAFANNRTFDEIVPTTTIYGRPPKQLRFIGRLCFLPQHTDPLISGVCYELEPTANVNSAQCEASQLSKELELAQRSNSELESFASTASHDLREPLRMVTSYLRLLQERYPEALDNRGRRYIDYATEGAERMRKLIEDLLDYARINKAHTPHEAVALDQVIAHAIENLSVTIQTAKAEVTVDINNAPVAWGDPIRLTRLFQNLIGNAVKFHAPEQTPIVKVHFYDGASSDKPDKWIVGIEDNGIGIDPDHENIPFNLFQRLNTRDEYEGSGIGLAICKKIAEQHEGETWFTSKRNEGSTFYVSLNKAQPKDL